MDENNGESKENLYNLFNMVAVVGLAGKTSHLISAALKGIACLAYEFHDLLIIAFDVLPLTYIYISRKNRDIVKASLGFLKVLVAKSQAEGLQSHLRCMVEVLLSWQSSSSGNQFRAEVKQILEILVKKCGLDAVMEVTREEHMKLLMN